MKKILSITLLITAIILCSCKEESSLRLGKDAEKMVKLLSYSFDANKDGSSVKSDFSLGSIKPANKVLATEIFEVCGESFTAMLIEEDSPIETKATYQNVDGSSIYTFYRYKNSEIRQQSIPTKEQGTNTFFVPQDKATNYGMIFMSKAEGMGNPNTITPTTINTSTKEITYNASFNENVCYVTFDRETMPTSNPIDLITFTPVFSQIGISAPAKISGVTTTISVDKVSLVSGAQEKATVKATYNSEETKNIRVSYDSVSTNYTVDLAHSLNATNDTTFLSSGGKLGYYNIIPNGNDAQISIKMLIDGKTVSLERTITFKDGKSNPIPFSCGKRYTIKITNNWAVPDKIYIEPETTTLVYGLTQPLKVYAKYNGREVEVTDHPELKWDKPTNEATVSTAGLATISKIGRSKFTVNLLGKTAEATITPDIHRTFKATEYYQWDAYEPYGTGDPNIWGQGHSGFNPTKGGGPENSNFSSAPSKDELKKYLGNDPYLSSTDGLIFTLEPDASNGTKLYCVGLWLKRQSSWKANATPKESVYFDESHKVRPAEDEISNYFFLPGSGSFAKNGSLGSYFDGGSSGSYWSSMSTPVLYDCAYSLGFLSTTNNAYVSAGSNRDYGFIPMSRL